MFRSVDIAYFQLIMPRESAWAIMCELGRLGKVEIIDHNEDQALINRPFANYVKRCDDLLLKLSQIMKEANELKLTQNLRKGTMSNFLKIPLLHSHTYLDQVEEFINQKMNYFTEHQKSYEQLNERVSYLLNHIIIMTETRSYLGQTLFMQREDAQQKFDYFVGIINIKEKQQFQRVVFRVTKGNAITHLKEISNSRFVFIVVYPNTGDYIKNKLEKLCESMSNGKYVIPNSVSQFDSKLADLDLKLNEAQHLLALTHTQLCNTILDLLKPEHGMSLIEKYRLFLLREKQLYNELNKLKMQGHLFIAELWVPKESIQALEQTLHLVKHSNLPSGQLAIKVPPQDITIPSYFKTNDFTSPFQEIVNTYGVPRYKEINPALLSIITFPFLFGVMFGDIGHGFLLMMFGVIQCFFPSEPFKEYRYLILMMGAFSFYAGWIYNDYLSISLNVFGSCYLQDGILTQSKTPDCNYPFGTDPAWGGNLEFGDSVKMKLSVIIAFFHMTMGIVMSGVNQLYNGDYFAFSCKFIPQITFLTCTIGYMDFLIVYKWLTPFTPENAPSIINTMIAMGLQFGQVDGLSMWNLEQQELVQFILITIAFLCIPWMWLPKILSTFFCQHSPSKSRNADYDHLVDESTVEMQEFQFQKDDVVSPPPESTLLEQPEPTHHQQQSHEPSEIIVHETIETIEFVLGVISNTASYLRLWALSLAHSQLAEVFYDLTLAEDVENSVAFKTIWDFPTFAMATFGVLMCMDSMECFLHSLRLHWQVDLASLFRVEFQNKFYKGDGVEFKAYQFNDQ